MTGRSSHAPDGPAVVDQKTPLHNGREGAHFVAAIAVTFPDTPWVYALSKQPPPRFQAGSDTELCYC